MLVDSEFGVYVEWIGCHGHNELAAMLSGWVVMAITLLLMKLFRWFYRMMIETTHILDGGIALGDTMTCPLIIYH